MGANAVTTVPVYTAGEVLTAADMNITNSGIPVFATSVTRDAAFGGAGEKTLAQGQFCYLESTSKLQVYTGSAWANVGTTTNVDRFTASGTWTVPAGVTYAIAHIQAGGGGVSRGAQGGTGGTSSVAFAGGTVSASGGVGGYAYYTNLAVTEQAGAANSGLGAIVTGVGSTAPDINTYLGGNGAYITAGAAVTPAASITITVGAGGTASNGGTGGTGYVWIEYGV